MKKDLSMEIRLLIAFVLMGVVLMATQYFIKPAPGPKPVSEKGAQSAQTKEAVQQTPAAAATTTQIPSPKAAEAAAEAVQASSEQTYQVDTDLYHVEFSNRGATVHSWILKDFKDHDGKPLELVYQKALGKVPAPFSLTFKGTAPSVDPNTALFKETGSDGGLTLDFEYSDGRALTKKTFQFEKNSYLVRVSTEVTQNGVMLPHSIVWRGGFGDAAALVSRGGSSVQHAIYYEIPNSKLQVKTAKDAKNGPVSATGQFSFVGIEDSYFAAAFLPADKSSVEETTFADNVPDAKGAEEQRVGVGVGGEGSNTVSLFVGPKDSDLLRKVDPKLEQVDRLGLVLVSGEAAVPGAELDRGSRRCTTTAGPSCWSRSVSI